MVEVLSDEIWTVAAAKARLSEVLRLAEEEGPQRIGKRKRFVVVSEHAWNAKTIRCKHMGQWLVEKMPRGADLALPDRNEPDRETSFADLEDA